MTTSGGVKTPGPDRVFYGGNFGCLGENCPGYHSADPMMMKRSEHFANLN